ncbi:MAG: MarR family transcriptional regulator [Candidatus Puniceispirillum sp.]|nr:MarR family transcriptional regulator [Candidatus Pelagibacter sp.]MBA4282841.1 MarR family transcriptional regulator [Candidatus Puniceispirillum sp.]
MKESYFEIVVMIERLHRLFLEVVKEELDSLSCMDITSVQALILYNIGRNHQLTVGELTNKGYYLGSNVSYNLRKMVKNGYVSQVPSAHDRRSSHVKLSQKGQDLFVKLEKAFMKHTENIQNDSKNGVNLDELNCHLKTFEVYWSSLVKSY